MGFLTTAFWQDALERAVKTVAQVGISMLGAGAAGLLSVDWVQLLSVTGLAGLISILTSIVSAKVTNTDSGSLIK